MLIPLKDPRVDPNKTDPHNHFITPIENIAYIIVHKTTGFERYLPIADLLLNVHKVKKPCFATDANEERFYAILDEYRILISNS